MQNKNTSENSKSKAGKKLCKSVLFTVAYYNALGYYPTSFFIWKNLIVAENIEGTCEDNSLMQVLICLEVLEEKFIARQHNGMFAIEKIFNRGEGKVLRSKYKKQIQKNKISVTKIRQMKKWIKFIEWLPYTRGMFLTGTLAMKRGVTKSDWDVLTVMKHDRIWIGRLILTAWLQLIGKRRYGSKVSDRFCLNQFIVSSRLKLAERNEFIGNELLMSMKLFKGGVSRGEFLFNNSAWLNIIKPNGERGSIQRKKEHKGILERIKYTIEWFFEFFWIASVINSISKKIMIRKIIGNPNTYTEQADIRYGDFFLVFLPYPQRMIIKKSTLKKLDNCIAMRLNIDKKGISV